MNKRLKTVSEPAQKRQVHNKQPEPTPSSSNVVLVTVSGPDRPGITRELTGVLADSDANILDMGQSVIHGLLSLSILFEMPPSDTQKATIKDLLFKATEMGLKLDFQVLTEGRGLGQVSQQHYVLTLIADRITARAVHAVSSEIARYKLNIDRIIRLSEGEFGCIEFILSSRQEFDRHDMNKSLLTIARNHGVDVALQPEGLFRRAKRLVVFDMDSTLIQNEVIDEFARCQNKYDEVAAITEEAMQGKLEFDESLRRRCELLKGLSHQDVEGVYQALQLTPGAEELIAVLKKLGYRIALISGGFMSIAETLKNRLGIDYAYANQMEFKDGMFTGRLIGPIVNAQRKADLMDVISQQERIQLDQVIAIGDGANDLLMLEKAGLGIAFNAKSAVSQKADFSISQKNLRSVLYLLGMAARDVTAALRD